MAYVCSEKNPIGIAVRGAQLVAPGGRLVYSTCSMNPMENEAVVAALLAQDPSLSVVDASRDVPQLLRRGALKTWKVLVDDDGSDGKGGRLREFATFEDVPDHKRKSTRSTLFPPTDARVKDMLRHCMRFVPHDSDTGAFFVTVLQKNACAPTPKATACSHEPAQAQAEKPAVLEEEEQPPPAAAAAAASEEEGVLSSSSEPRLACVREAAEEEGIEVEGVPSEERPAKLARTSAFAANKTKPEDFPFVEFGKSVDLGPLAEFYGLSEDFPRELLVVRRCADGAVESSKKVLLVSKAVQRVAMRAADSKQSAASQHARESIF